MAGYQESLTALAAGAVRQVVAAYLSFLDGLLTRDETVRYIASAIAVANGRARALADVAMATEVMAQLGEAVPVQPLERVDDTERLIQAVTTIFDESEPEVVDLDTSTETTAPAEPAPRVRVRLERLAKSEPLEQAADAASEALAKTPQVTGWTRQLSANACQLCRWWWREGRIWPAEHPFQHHKGCACTPKPVVTDQIQETRYTKKLKGIR
ncbi:hypothetical protein [Gordonia sp. ABSL49_1]|uniref:hypothetical protein n=1 Tax=Gordonia sp. ABSL49_1 TaxID=2920941 RepID=UPI001F113AAB|nr:hypothetical protein [Gordonia sp. ABSL49_1]MCH5641434.1 hypothetical protein [Gordonia sp. ABSL49_1]